MARNKQSPKRKITGNVKKTKPYSLLEVRTCVKFTKRFIHEIGLHDLVTEVIESVAPGFSMSDNALVALRRELELILYDWFQIRNGWRQTHKAWYERRSRFVRS